MGEKVIKIKLKDIYDDIYDYENRLHIINEFAKMIGLDDELINILAFISMGNVFSNPSLPDVLKKTKIPVVPVEYDKDKLKKWQEYLVRELKAIDKYGVLDMSKMEILKATKNGKYLTILSVKILPLIYMSVLSIIEKNPQYILSVMYGVYKALEKILMFLGATEVLESGEEKLIGEQVIHKD